MATDAELREQARRLLRDKVDLGAVPLQSSQDSNDIAMESRIRKEQQAPSEEEMAHDVRQGSNDAAASEDANRHEPPINKYNVRSAARNVLPYVSPAAAYALNKATSDENSADLDASNQTATKNVVGQTGNQVAQGAIERENAMPLPGSQQRVVGYTKGGFVPTTQQSQAQVSREQMPDGYWDLANQEMGHKTEAAMGALDYENRLGQEAQRTGDIQRKFEDTMAEQDRQAGVREDAALTGAQGRINSAIQEFQNSGPKFINYRNLWDEKDTGGKVVMALGFIAGALSSQDGHNAFFQGLDKQIERKIDIQQRESEQKGQAIGYANNAYQVLNSRIHDSRATRNILTAMYKAQLANKIKDRMDAIGMAPNAKSAAILGKLEDDYRLMLKDGAFKVVESEANAQRYAPPTAIKVGPSDAEQQAAYGETQDYEHESRKSMLPNKRAGVQLLNEGAQQISDKGAGGRFFLKRYLMDPTSKVNQIWLEQQSPEDRNAINKIDQGFNIYLRQEGGKALPKEEVALEIASKIGNGSKKDLMQGVDSAQREVNELEKNLHSNFQRGYPRGNLNRKIYSNTEQPHELSGHEKERDQYKDVVSPEPNIPIAEKKKGKKED